MQVKDYGGPVYNLQVAEDESFIAGGIVVHNCVMLPTTLTYEELGIDAPEPDFSREMGPDWFERQDEATQRRMMGTGKYDAWRAGKFELSDIPGLREDATWGNSWTPRALKDLVPAEAQ